MVSRLQMFHVSNELIARFCGSVGFGASEVILFVDS